MEDAGYDEYSKGFTFNYEIEDEVTVTFKNGKETLNTLVMDYDWFDTWDGIITPDAETHLELFWGKRKPKIMS